MIIYTETLFRINFRLAHAPTKKLINIYLPRSGENRLFSV